jgi:hypothetical protein
MNARCSEGGVSARILATDIEVVGLGEFRWIAIGGIKTQQ